MLFLTRLKSALTAFWLFARDGDVALRVAVRREMTCSTCPHQTETATGIFCAACGCPQWPGSDLRTKWRMPGLKCPLNHW